MFLKNFVYVNWGNIPSLEFEFGPVNLFSGGNGSGKTTAADAIQTIMTAAHENLFQFNPGQDETTQRGRGGKRVRTLASYILGCDDGSYARLTQVDGYLAANFHPTKGESGEPFTAVIGVRAWLDSSGKQSTARQEDVQFFIVKGASLNLTHFVRDDLPSKSGKHVASLPDLQNLLIVEFGKNDVERYETKKAYLKRLYASLRGMDEAVSETEAVAAARAFSRFMAYKPVKNINSFVADEILEEKDLGEAIRSVSSQLKTIHNMEREAARLVNSIEILDSAKKHSQTYIAHWIDLNVLDYTLAKAEFETRQNDYVRGKQFQKTQRQALHDTEAEIQSLQNKSDLVHDQLISLEAKRQGIGALREKDELENQKIALDKNVVLEVREVLAQDQCVATNIAKTEEITLLLSDKALSNALPRAVDTHAQKQANAVIDSGNRVVKDLHDLLQKDISGDLPQIEEKMPSLLTVQQAHNDWYSHWHSSGHEADDKTESLRDQLSAFVLSRKNRHQNLGDQRESKQQEIDRLSANHVIYPSYVVRAIKAIEQECPTADPRVLCDHIEVSDARWQSAIEGYIGGARFSILVEAKYEATAANIVCTLPGRDNRARVIQGEKAAEDADRINLHADSIIHVMDFSHSVARDYLIASYGTVLQVNSTEKLRKTRRGITEDGMGSGNYSMWRCDLADGDLVFGVAARERALLAKQSELQQIEIDWHAATEQYQQYIGLLRAVDAIKPTTYADALGLVIVALREIQILERLLGQLDLSEHKELEESLTALKAEQDVLSASKDKSHQTLGAINKNLKDIEKQIKAITAHKEQQIDRVEACEAALNAIVAIWPDFNASERLEYADKEAIDLNIEHAGNFRQTLEKNLHSVERKIADNIQNHNQHCRASDAIAYTDFMGGFDVAFFKAICELQREIDRLFNTLKNNILVEKHQQLTELKEAFNSAFVTHLCHTIHQALNDGKRQIALLNEELQHHQFGADRETFRFDSEWIPEYRDYARFFEELVKNPMLGDEVTLFEAEMSEKSKKVLAQLMGMLLDEDDVRAMRELDRIADYRNYRRYEIYKEVEGKEPIALSEYGTGSGGQLETPAYIIRAAAITSAFRFSEGNTHLRMVLVDEAFSKMDETRSREVIHYLTQSLGLQLVFIMPTSKCGPFMDLISNEFVFAKVPSDVKRGQLNTRVLVDRKKCNQERIKTLWENHRKTIRQQADLDFMEAVLAE